MFTGQGVMLLVGCCYGNNATALVAASLRSSAGVICNPLSFSSCLAVSTFVPVEIGPLSMVYTQVMVYIIYYAKSVFIIQKCTYC